MIHFLNVTYIGTSSTLLEEDRNSDFFFFLFIKMDFQYRYTKITKELRSCSLIISAKRQSPTSRKRWRKCLFRGTTEGKRTRGNLNSIVNCKTDFLSNRSQRIKLGEGYVSEWESVHSGVPQRAKLGPWLFFDYD